MGECTTIRKKQLVFMTQGSKQDKPNNQGIHKDKFVRDSQEMQFEF